MLSSKDTILVAISGPHRKVVRRAAEIACCSGAAIELLSVIRPLIPPYPLMADTLVRTSQMVHMRRAQLEKVATPLRKKGLKVTTTVEVDDYAVDGLLRYIKRTAPSLLAIEAHHHIVLSRLLLSQTDYSLIRRCPIPLLVVKGGPMRAGAAVLAAVDPSLAGAKPADLDVKIVKTARELSATVKGTLHSAHVYPPLVGYIGDAAFAPVAIPASLPEQARYAAKMRASFKSFNERHRIPGRTAHLRMGDPVRDLPALAKRLRARVVVMGAVSLRFIRRALLGSTAEKVLDALPCDLLIVKPQGFRDAA